MKGSAYFNPYEDKCPYIWSVKKTLLSFLFFYSLVCFGQDSVLVSGAKEYSGGDFTKKKWAVGSLTAAVYGGSFIFLSTAWYKDQQRTGFHVYNDGGEWQQVDKVGHAWTAYHTSRMTTSAWQ